MKRLSSILVVLLALACGPGKVTESKKRDVTVTVTPPAITVGANAIVGFNAIVAGTTDLRVTWSANGGGITTAGLYTAPSTFGTYQITATSVAVPSRSGTATVTVNPQPVVVSVSPAAPSGIGCEIIQLTATVTGGRGNRAVTWSLADPPLAGGPGLGSVDSNGRYTLPDPRPYSTMVTHVAATSVEDPTAHGIATVTTNTTVTGVVVTPASVTMQASGTQQFTAVVKTSCDP